MRPLPDTPKDTRANNLGQAAHDLAHHLPTDTCKTDPDLAAVVDAWLELPKALKAGIVAMIRAARTRGPESPAGAGQCAD